MLSSIRTQLIAVLVALVALILAQGFIARENQVILSDGVSSAAKAVVDVGLVKELERDVVDLQRNVLIFKENASQSAITRFGRLMVTINAKLDQLAQADTLDVQADDDYILNRMREHLSAYQENFNQVVDARSERDNLVAYGTLSDISTLERTLQDALDRNALNEESLDSALSLLLQAENAMLKYLSKPDINYTKSFNDAINSFKALPLSDDDAVQGRIYSVD